MDGDAGRRWHSTWIFDRARNLVRAVHVAKNVDSSGRCLPGSSVGIVIWVAMELVVLPYMNPTMAARIALMPMAYFIAHCCTVSVSD